MADLNNDGMEEARKKIIDALTAISTLQKIVTEAIMGIESSVDSMPSTKEAALKKLELFKNQLITTSKECRSNINSAMSSDSRRDRSHTPPPNLEDLRTDPFSENESYGIMFDTGSEEPIRPNAIEFMRVYVDSAIIAVEELLDTTNDCSRERALDAMRLVKGLLNNVTDQCLMRIDDTVTRFNLK